MLRFAVDEVCTVHFLVLPRWKKPPTLSHWGQPTPTPRPVDVASGRGPVGVKPLAHFSIIVEGCVQVRFALEPGAALVAPYRCVIVVFFSSLL